MANIKEIKVLVVEDSQMFQSLALSMLPNCRKHSATTSREGYGMFKRIMPDITFLDIGLPDGSGLDLLKKMREINPKAFVVMFTQSRVSTDVATAVKFGAAGYISKPFSQKEVMGYFNKYLESNGDTAVSYEKDAKTSASDSDLQAQTEQ